MKMAGGMRNEDTLTLDSDDEVSCVWHVTLCQANISRRFETYFFFMVK